MKMTKEEATEFFAEYYGGKHNIPGHEVAACGPGWSVFDNRGGLASYDTNGLTRLVVMAHDRCIRVEVSPWRNTTLRIAIYKRQRIGDLFLGHPTMEQAIEKFRGK